MFKIKTKLGNNFYFKDQIPKDLTSDVVSKCQCGLCKEPYHGEGLRHLSIRTGEDIGISPLPENKSSLRKTP